MESRTDGLEPDVETNHESGVEDAEGAGDVEDTKDDDEE